MAAPLRSDLVLLGGGHTHMLALRRLTMQPPPGARLTLVSDHDYAAYSGMLPGLVAGHYRFDEAHIDLRRFCAARGVRFIRAAVTGVDATLGRVQLANRPSLEYDLLSINVGAQPELSSVPGALEYALPVKPVGSFYKRWSVLLDSVIRHQGRLCIPVVGGGAGSVEIALAVDFRLQGRADVALVCGSGLLPGYNPRVRKTVRRVLQQRGIRLYEESRVQSVQAGVVQIEDGTVLEFDELLWCTGVAAAAWLRTSGLTVNDAGFLLVDDSLQLEGCPGVFAAGDVAVQRDNPRPRAGVFAVRQSPVLADNLAASMAGKPLRKHQPQQLFLSLLSLGDAEAVAERGPFTLRGKWIWRWKDHIDQKFMAQFTAPATAMELTQLSQNLCGGCGAKLPADRLRQALAVVASAYPNTVVVQQLHDDAALLSWQAGSTLVQSVDSLRALVDDMHQMGRIAAVHALSDLYAMGATPKSAQLHLCLPEQTAKLQQRDLEQLLLGVVCELASADCQLVGGHSMEGAELSIGLTVNGALEQGGALRKQGGEVGDAVLVTKPLGVGVAFAAAMQAAASSASLSAALQSMLVSNAAAAIIAREQHVSACTDLTGFGLLGHLLEMLPSRLAAMINPELVPLFPGTKALWEAGYRSTLHAGNEVSVRSSLDWPPSCFDPQTSGGLLLFVEADRAQATLDALQSSGYEQAAIIGKLCSRDNGDALRLSP
ncbi:MAG: selenide, water dikinase SelD [Pseudomonadota bacterium]